MSKSDGRIHASNQRPFKPPFFFKYLSTQRITTDSKMENSLKRKNSYDIQKTMEKTKISKRNTHAPALSIMAQGVLRGDFFLEPTKTISGAQRGVPARLNRQVPTSVRRIVR